MKVPVIIVDDSETDRYIIRRRLSRADGFEVCDEFAAGDRFVDAFFNDETAATRRDVLVLLDINMPRQSGFETADEIEARLSQTGNDRQRCVVAICSTSENPADIGAADAHPRIAGYFVKPLSAGDCDRLKAIWSKAAGPSI